MPSRARSNRRRSKTHASGFIILGLLVAIISAFVLITLGGCKVVDSWLEDLPDYQDADAYVSAEPTKILDADGNLIAELYLQNRETITIDEVSPYVLQATIDTEDERFRSHKGVDIQGIGRAAIGRLTGTSSEGGSTITQQLVRNTVLSDEQFEISIRRKVREAYIALQLEKQYSKDQILMMYLNTIYYGEGAYGIEAASQTFFSKPASELTLPEAALLSGLPQSPSNLNPLHNPEGAKNRRDLVLRRMLSNGDISQEEFDHAVATPIELNHSETKKSGALKYPYFVDHVIRQLNKEFSNDVILKGGLTVTTTISPEIQEYAEEACNERIQSSHNDKYETALISIDPKTGYILAMVGGKDYSEDQFNLATQAKRQAGSSFKVFTLAAAIENGMSPDTVFSGRSPITIGNWKPKNFGNTSYGSMSVRRATWKSVNTVFAQMIDAIGADKVVDIAGRMGIKSELPAYNSISLGTAGVSVLEMASANATLAAGGVYREPTCVTEIKDRHGDVIYKHNDDPVQAIDKGVAAEVTDVLEGVITSGTGTRARLSVNQPVAGKTGTTQDTRDLWFVGYTPQLATAIWTGYRNEDTIRYRGGVASTGVTSSTVFKNFMNMALEGLPREEFPEGKVEYKKNSSWKSSVPKQTDKTRDDVDEGRPPEEDKEQKKAEETSKQAEGKQDKNNNGGNQNESSGETPTKPEEPTPPPPEPPEEPEDPGDGGGGGEEEQPPPKPPKPPKPKPELPKRN